MSTTTYTIESYAANGETLAYIVATKETASQLFKRYAVNAGQIADGRSVQLKCNMVPLITVFAD